MFSCNDDHLRAAPSGYPHQVIHISNTQGTPEQVSSPRGGGADPKPQPNTTLPCAPPRLGPRSGAGQMPESGDESQGITVKGLRCPLGYPRSDLGRLQMIARRTGTMPRCHTRAPSCGSLGSTHLRRGRRIPKKVRGGGGQGDRGAQLFEPRARAGGVGATSRYLLPASVAPGGGHSVPCAGAIVHVRVCTCVHVRACGNDPSAGSPTETLLRLLLPIESQVWPSSCRPVMAQLAGVAPCQARPGRSPRASLNLPIGSSDGRCVQRAGT